MSTHPESRFPLSPLRDGYTTSVLADSSRDLAYLPTSSPEWHRAYDLMVDARDSLMVRADAYSCPPGHRVVRYDAETDAYVPVENRGEDCELS